MANNKSIFQKISNFFEPSKQNIIQDTVEKSIISDPGLPPAPISQKEKGRNWDYPSQSNAVRSPEKSRYEALRIIADACSLVRLAIETRKDQISRFKWKIVLKNKATKTTNRKTIELEAFFQSPDKDQKFHEWLRPIIEDMFVIDAVAIYPRKTLGGQLYSLETIDAATITKIIDSTGRTPTDEEAIAYIQEIKGLPISSYTT